VNYAPIPYRLGLQTTSSDNDPCNFNLTSLQNQLTSLHLQLTCDSRRSLCPIPVNLSFPPAPILPSIIDLYSQHQLPHEHKMPPPTALIIPAVKRHTATVIMAHGLGDSGAGWVGLAENWRRRQKFEEVKFIFPNAPNIPITVVRLFTPPLHKGTNKLTG
jgi:hypothetical protein